MVAQSGSCAGTLEDYNYIVSAPGSPATWDPITEEAYGVVTLGGSIGALTVSGTQRSLDCILPGVCTVDDPINGPPPGTCEDGTITFQEMGVVVARGAVTPSGAAVIDSGPGNGGITLFAQNALGLADVGNRTYVGILSKPNTGDSDPVQVLFTNDTDGIGVLFTDVESNTLDGAEAVSLTLTSITDGRVEGVINNQSTVQTPFAAATLQSGGRTLLYLVGHTDEAGDPPIVGLLVSQ